MNSEEKKVVTVGDLPDNPLKMPPPYWRGSGAIFQIKDALLELEELLQQLLHVHTSTEILLDTYYKKYPNDDVSDLAMEEFVEITDELSELEPILLI